MRALLLILLAAVLALPGRAHAGAVAVLYFENQGNPELEQLKVGLTQMLITDLGQEPGLVVVERTRLQEVLNELELGHSGKVTPESAAQIGKLLGADRLIMGAYFELMGTMRVDARIVDVETGKVLASHGASDIPQAFMALEKGLARDLARSLQAGGETGQAPTTGPDTRTASASTTPAVVATADTTRSTPAAAKTKRPPPLPPTASSTVVVAPDATQLDAALAFSEGLVHLDRKDVPRAREAFEKALTTEPGLQAARVELDRLSL